MENILSMMDELIQKENAQRSAFIEKYSEKLPETFCPYLTRRINEDITKPLEAFFKSDTEATDLNEDILNDVMSMTTPSQDRSYAPI